MVSDINLVISMKLTSKISIILVVLVLMSGCLIGVILLTLLIRYLAEKKERKLTYSV